jgi:hypothetical protein
VITLHVSPTVGNTIGGSPRVSGSGLSPAEVQELVNGVTHAS